MVIAICNSHTIANLEEIEQNATAPKPLGPSHSTKRLGALALS